LGRAEILCKLRIFNGLRYEIRSLSTASGRMALNQMNHAFTMSWAHSRAIVIFIVSNDVRQATIHES
jgi:hypothetical protein